MKWFFQNLIILAFRSFQLQGHSSCPVIRAILRSQALYPAAAIFPTNLISRYYLPQVKYGGRSPQVYLSSMSRDVHSCTHWLRPRNSPSPRITRALLPVGQQRQTTSLCDPLLSTFKGATHSLSCQLDCIFVKKLRIITKYKPYVTSKSGAGITQPFHK